MTARALVGEQRLLAVQAPVLELEQERELEQNSIVQACVPQEERTRVAKASVLVQERE